MDQPLSYSLDQATIRRRFFFPIIPFHSEFAVYIFSFLDTRVLDCLGSEKQKMYALCRPGVNASKSVFKMVSISTIF
jgi:hypothetical protein